MTTMTETASGLREFKMPDVGEGLTEAEILKWYVQPGDTVTDGQVVCEVETAKAAVELPIPYDGVVHELRFPEGTTVDVGQVIIAVDVGGGAAPVTPAAPAAQAEAPAPSQAPTVTAPTAPATAPAVPAAPSGEAGGTTAEPEPEGRKPVLVGYGVSVASTKRRPRRGVPAQQPEVAAAAAAVNSELNGHAAPAARPLAKPPVRKLAKDLGVDLAAVTPSGPDGIITREDVHAAVAPAPASVQEPVVTAAPAVAAPVSAPAAAAIAAPAVSYDGVRETRVPVKGVRKAIAAAMVGSAFTAPHVTEFVTVDVTRTMKLVEEPQAVRRVRDAGAAGEPAAADRQGPAGRHQAPSGRQRLMGRGQPGDRAEALCEPGHRGGHASRSDRPEHQGRARQDASAARGGAGGAGRHRSRGAYVAAWPCRAGR